MRLDIPTVIVTLIVSAAIFFSAAIAFLPESTVVETVEVGRELTDSEELAVDCYEIMEMYFNSPEDSPEEDAAFDEQEERGCWPYGSP